MCERVSNTTSGVETDLGLPDIVVGVVPHTGFLVNRLMRLTRVHAALPRDT